MSERVLVAHHQSGLRDALLNELTARGLECAAVRQADELLLAQAALRPSAVILSAQWTLAAGARIVSDLRRDMNRPYLLICSSEGGRNIRAFLRMGASAVSCEENPEAVCALLEANLRRRACREADGDSTLGGALVRLFAEYGLPCHLRGYRYLLLAARMLVSGEGRPDQLGPIYRRLSERFGCSESAIERGMAHAVSLCAQRSLRSQGKECVMDFLVRVLEETRCVVPISLIRPRVSVFSGEERRIY